MNGIGARLKLARQRARFSQQELANHAGVSAMAISKYERDKDMPSSGVLIKLAAALDVSVEFFLRAAPDLDIQPVYRKHSKMGEKAKEAVTAQIQEWLERYITAESFLPLADRQIFEQPEGFPWKISSLSDAEQAAEGLRTAWRLGESPIENLVELLEDRGIKVGLVDGDEHFDACTFWVSDGDAQPVIALKRDQPGDRARFSLAHELGHLMLDVPDDIDEEKTAHRFAGAFLVPAAVARRELGVVRHNLDPHELSSLKQKYGLSMSAWVHRAQDLDILSASRAKSMWKLFGLYGWRKQEPGVLPSEEPGRMDRLVRRLLAEQVISESRAAELLGLSLSVYLKQRESIYAGAQ